MNAADTRTTILVLLYFATFDILLLFLMLSALSACLKAERWNINKC